MTSFILAKGIAASWLSASLGLCPGRCEAQHKQSRRAPGLSLPPALFPEKDRIRVRPRMYILVFASL